MAQKVSMPFVFMALISLVGSLWTLIGAFVCLTWFVRIGGVMHELVHGGWFGGGSRKAKLNVAFSRMQRWCKTFGKKPSLRKFSVDNMNMKKGQFPDACSFESVVLLNVCLFSADFCAISF